MIPLARMLLMLITFTRLVLSFASHKKPEDIIQRRTPTTCGWDLGTPNPDDCKVAIDYEIPSSSIYEDIHFIPIGTAGPDNAVVLPQFYQHGDCIISVDTIEPDLSNWIMVKAAAMAIVDDCLEKPSPQGGMKDLGDDEHMLVMMLSATNSNKPTLAENEAMIHQVCEQGKGHDLQYCSDYQYYQNMEGPDSPGGARVCPQKDAFGTFYCKQSKDCCQGFICSLKTLKTTSAAILLGVQKILVNTAGICIATASV
ncbi:MAG: hypothetical protein M1836_004608 [Candelina mexicana]|nr:MAG: hypothetical protein M1836_004608 [Candelina mexicana]